MKKILPWNVPFVFPSEESLNQLSSTEIAAATAVLSFIMNETYTNIEPSFTFSSDDLELSEIKDEA